MPLTAPTLAVTDNADGTGVTVSLTGGDGSASNIVYRQPFTSDPNSQTWTSFKTQTGNGSSTVACANGIYWFHCASSLSGETAVSNIVHRIVTDGESSVFVRCKNAIVARLQALNLTDIGSKVFSRPFPSGESVTMPCVIVTSQPTPVSMQSATNYRDERGYPVQVMFLMDGAKAPNLPEDKIWLWRQTAERAFSGQRIDVAEVRRCEVEPAMVLDPNDPAYERVVSAFTVRCLAWEPRGLGV